MVMISAEKLVAAHQHHWIIAEANGPMSDGVCKGCGVLRAFPNALPEPDYIEGVGSDARHSWRRSPRPG
jgi:hypothetical protein